jgi:hypothetical protein
MDGDGTPEVTLDLSECGGTYAPPIPPKDIQEPETYEANCSAAQYLAEFVIDIVETIDLIADTLGNPVYTYDGVRQWEDYSKAVMDYGYLQDVFLSLPNGYTNMVSDVQTIETEMNQVLYCSDLNPDTLAAWVETYEAIAVNSRYQIAQAIRSISNDEWSKQAFIGSVQANTGCLECGAWCIEAFTGGGGLQQWQIVTYSPVTCTAYMSGTELQSCTATGHVQWAVRLDVPPLNTITDIRCKVRSTNTTGDERVYCHILDENGVIVASGDALIPIGTGATNELCLQVPETQLQHGGAVVLYTHADSANYSYVNLVNVQVDGIGIEPYTANCATIYNSCGTCATYDFELLPYISYGFGLDMSGQNAIGQYTQGIGYHTNGENGQMTLERTDFGIEHIKSITIEYDCNPSVQDNRFMQVWYGATLIQNDALAYGLNQTHTMTLPQQENYDRLKITFGEAGSGGTLTIRRLTICED